MDTHGGQKEPLPRPVAPAGVPTDRSATEGFVDRHPEVVPSHVVVVEVSLDLRQTIDSVFTTLDR